MSSSTTDKVKGAVDRAVGRAKQGVGSAVDNGPDEGRRRGAGG